MVQIEGNYQHEKSENLDKFFEKMGNLLFYFLLKILCLHRDILKCLYPL